MATKKTTPTTKQTKKTKQPKTSVSKAVAAKTPAAAASTSTPRRVKRPVYQSFRLQRKIKITSSGLPGSFRLLWRSLGVLKKHWKVFLMLLLVYGLVDFIVVQGFSAGNDVTGSQGTLRSLFNGHIARVASGISLFLYMVGSASQGSPATAGSNQFFWVVLSSLAFIWALRQVYSKTQFRARDAYYRGAYPLITFILVLTVIALELAPAIIGGIIFGIATGGAASTGIEQVLWALVLAGAILLSLYLIISSFFALYIICLPDMTPFKALRSAHEIVAYRRWTVLRKILFLPCALVVLGGLVVIPLIILVPSTATWTFYILSLLALPVLHSYYYALYRALLEV